MATIATSLACMSAFIGGAASIDVLCVNRQQSIRHKELRKSWAGDRRVVTQRGEGLAAFVLKRFAQFNLAYSAHTKKSIPWLNKLATRDVAKLLVFAGYGDIQYEALCAWRIRALIVGLFFGFALGQLISPVAGFVLGVVGLVVGWQLLRWALKQAAAERRFGMEQHISEALEVFCLGLRAGLSFERSLDLYCANFDSSLSREFLGAQQAWRTGLLSREEALSNLASGYNSPLFARVCESITRSLKFGSSLAPSLEELALEARQNKRASMEEAVMKAPVKMMVPIGLLILPSMLLLVMGPIMLELIEGF